jgi:hypothetical protein
LGTGFIGFDLWIADNALTAGIKNIDKNAKNISKTGRRIIVAILAIPRARGIFPLLFSDGFKPVVSVLKVRVGNTILALFSISCCPKEKPAADTFL